MAIAQHATSNITLSHAYIIPRILIVYPAYIWTKRLYIIMIIRSSATRLTMRQERYLLCIPRALYDLKLYLNVYTQWHTLGLGYLSLLIMITSALTSGRIISSYRQFLDQYFTQERIHFYIAQVPSFEFKNHQLKPANPSIETVNIVTSQGTPIILYQLDITPSRATKLIQQNQVPIVLGKSFIATENLFSSLASKPKQVTIMPNKQDGKAMFTLVGNIFPFLKNSTPNQDTSSVHLTYRTDQKNQMVERVLSLKQNFMNNTILFFSILTIAGFLLTWITTIVTTWLISIGVYLIAQFKFKKVIKLKPLFALSNVAITWLIVLETINNFFRGPINSWIINLIGYLMAAYFIFATLSITENIKNTQLPQKK